MSDFVQFYQQQPEALLFSVILISLMVGSFLNVVILRLPIMMFRGWIEETKDLKENLPDHPALKDLSKPYNLAKPDSHCPKCQAPVKPWMNIPIVSYLVLKGQCNSCGVKISARYPIVEFVTAVLSGLLLLEFDFSIQLLAMLVFTWMLVAMSMIDIDHQILPDNMTLPLMWLGILLATQDVFIDLESSVYGAMAGYLSLWSVYWLFKLATGKEGMGYGDFKLLAALGAWMGWKMIPLIVLLSSFVGAFVGIIGIMILGRDKNIPIPFGPYLAAAGWIAFMWGDDIIQWYMSTL